jgi:hypothetical protein
VTFQTGTSAGNASMTRRLHATSPITQIAQEPVMRARSQIPGLTNETSQTSELLVQRGFASDRRGSWFR